MNHSTVHRGMSSHAWARSGFSLVEVLIAIFVLALGLLGVAAVFPAVVRQQRSATDSVQGISMQRSVEEIIRNNSRLSERSTPPLVANSDQTVVIARGWSLLLSDAAFSPVGQWVPSNLLAGDAVSGGTNIDPTTGDMRIGGAQTLADFEVDPIIIAQSERLIPRPAPGSTIDPRYVWDFIARRVETGTAENLPGTATPSRAGHDDDMVQLAVFVRRIDNGIRVPGGRTLSDVLAGNVNGTLRVAVAEDDRGNPTFDGLGGGDEPRYSPIRSTLVNAVEVDEGGGTPVLRFDVIRAQNETSLEQVGQKFVSPLGTVHEVVSMERLGTVANSYLAMTIEPPLPAAVAFRDGDIADVRVHFTRQAPAAVSIVNIKR
jgi:prepilin-type N-terminal cleavage/methylation domain-containing protein